MPVTTKLFNICETKHLLSYLKHLRTSIDVRLTHQAFWLELSVCVS